MVAKENKSDVKIPRLTLKSAATTEADKDAEESSVNVDGSLVPQEDDIVSRSPRGSKAQLGRLIDMFSPSLRRTTLTLWPIWLNTALAYYGIVLVTTEVFEMNGTCGASGQNASSKDGVYSDDCYVQCRMLSVSDYISIMFTSFSEFPSIAVTLFVIDLFGRRFTMAMTYLVYTGATFLLTFCMDRTAVTAVLFVSRAFISSAFQAIYVYTPEVYPTSVRAVGLGTCSSLSRLGAIFTPMIAQILTKTNMAATFYTYTIAGAICFVLTITLPIETRGRVTHDTLR